MNPDLIKIMEDIARKKPVKVVICEGYDERCLRAAEQVLKKKLAKVVLLGEPEVIQKKAKELRVNIRDAEIIDFKKSELKEELATKLFELRKNKGITLQDALNMVENENYFACMYVFAGYADAVGGSAICSTADLMRPALQILRDTAGHVSEITVLDDTKNNRVFFATDLSMSIEPTAEELAKMTLNAVKCARSFGVMPRVALLSFSTKGSGGDHLVLKPIRDAVELIKKQEPELAVDGEMQLDAAVSEFAAKRKCPDSVIQGNANVLVFPNLTASNIFAHGLMQFSSLQFKFTVMGGLLKPVAIFGRSTPLEFVRNLIVSCAMQVNVKEP